MWGRRLCAWLRENVVTKPNRCACANYSAHRASVMKDHDWCTKVTPQGRHRPTRWFTGSVTASSQCPCRRYWTKACPAMITLALGPACAAHQLQARLQPAVIGLGPVVGGLLGSVPRWREQLLEHHRVGRCPVGDDLHRRYLRRAERPLEEAGSGCRVPPWEDHHVDDLAELIDRSVHIPPSAGDLHVGLVPGPAISHGVPAWAGGRRQ
jgi:hypothetical protein